MKTVTLGISSRKDIEDRFLSAFDGENQGAFISFETPALLFKIISGKRWEIIQAMTGAGPLSIREVARRLARDVKAVHSDVHILLKAGILIKTESGQIEFPFDAIHVNFVLEAA